MRRCTRRCTHPLARGNRDVRARAPVLTEPRPPPPAQGFVKEVADSSAALLAHNPEVAPWERRAGRGGLGLGDEPARVPRDRPRSRERRRSRSRERRRSRSRERRRSRSRERRRSRSRERRRSRSRERRHSRSRSRDRRDRHRREGRERGPRDGDETKAPTSAAAMSIAEKLRCVPLPAYAQSTIAHTAARAARSSAVCLGRGLTQRLKKRARRCGGQGEGSSIGQAGRRQGRGRNEEGAPGDNPEG